MNVPAGNNPNGAANHTAVPFRVAVVGAGPTGCYTVQALRKTLTSIEVTVFDHLPTPFGLVRHGIAPDHQGAKAVSRQFDRLFSQPGIEFVGNVMIGREVELATLAENFDAVILATGLGADNGLDIDADPNARVIGAGDLIRLLNSDPDSLLRVDPSGLQSIGEEVVIIGTGNVSVDVARLLAKSDLDFIASDIDDKALRAVAPRPVRTIHILGRCEPQFARWDQSMVKELSEVVGVSLRVDGVPVLDGVTPPPRTTINVWFRLIPRSIKSHHGRVRITALDARNANSSTTFEADSVITALGFAPSTRQPNSVSGTQSANIFPVGGPASGRLGNLAENRKLAGQAASEIIDFLRTKVAGNHAGLDGLRGELSDTSVSFRGWKRIEAEEARRARPGRCRTKFTTRAELLAVSNNDPSVLTPNTLVTTVAPAPQEN